MTNPPGTGRQPTEGRPAPQVRYTVERRDGAWKVVLNDRQFGPYSTLETAVAAASRAAHKAEAQGYEAVVDVRTREPEGEPPESEATPAGRSAA